MLTTFELLDALRARRGLTTDYQLAKYLGVPTATVSQWRTGKHSIGPELALRFADELEISREFVLACLEAERHAAPELRSAWAAIAARLRGAAVIVAVVLLGGAAVPSTAYGAGLSSPVYTLCALGRRRARRRLDRWMARFLGTWFPAHLLQPLAVRP